MKNLFLVDMDFVFWLLLVPIIIIFALIIVAIVIRIVKYNKLKKAALNKGADEDQRTLFIEVYGGKDNIVNANYEMSRLTVEVHDLNLVNLNKLKELGASGVLVTGNVVKASFGERAKYICELLK